MKQSSNPLVTTLVGGVVFLLPLVVVLSIGTLLMAPLALVGLLCWWLIRALLRDNRPGPSATMAG